MVSFRDVSIKRKLTTIILLSSSIALVLSCAALATYDWISYERALINRIRTMAEILGLNSTAALAFDNAQDAQETLSALRVKPHVVAAYIYGADGGLFATYSPTGQAFTPANLREDNHYFVDNQLHLLHIIQLDGLQVGSIYIITDLSEMQDRLLRYAGIVALAILIASIGSFLVGARLRDQISTPLLSLAAQMRIVSSAQDYSVRAQSHSRDELGELIDGFNDMLEQIQDRDAALIQARDDLSKKAEELQLELVERHRIEAQITASLEEKEVLLKEIHHRVKNNLQVISSLLDLQANNIRDEHTVAMFRDSQNRITSMGLIHERLYQASDLARIEFSEYIAELTQSLYQSYSTNAQNVRMSTTAETISLDVDTSIPCGLIINELVSNALKYAFPDGREGCINVELEKCEANQLLLVVRDDGIGLPEEFDASKTQSLGLKLVHTLVRQLRGTLEISSSHGARFSIRFPIKS